MGDGAVLFSPMTTKEYVPLNEFSHYKIGGLADVFIEANDHADLVRALRWANEEEGSIFILGSGTNLIMDDLGYAGIVIKPNIRFLEEVNGRVRAGAGTLMSELLDFAAERGLSGLEWAGGLPGTVGGAVRGNAGAFGGEVKDSIESVDSFDAEVMQPMRRSNTESRFGYRASVFKERKGKEVVTAATFKLKQGDHETIKKLIKEKIDYRSLRHPMEYPNIGSIFKNVNINEVPPRRLRAFRSVIKTDPFPVIPAAYLISEAGLKGVARGGAMVSPKHPNFIVNVFDAKACDVRSLMELVKQEVFKKFKVRLEPEVEIVTQFG